MQFITFPSTLIEKLKFLLRYYIKASEITGRGGEVLRISGFFSLWANILLIVQKLHFVGLGLQYNGHPHRLNPELFPKVSPLLYLLFHLDTILAN